MPEADDPEDHDFVVTPAWSMFPVKRFIVHGRVQGVGFRWWTYQLANEWKLLGSVRNCPDGTVEVVLAGESFAIGRVADMLEHGPPAAQVVSVESEDVAPGSIPVPSSFEVWG